MNLDITSIKQDQPQSLVGNSGSDVNSAKIDQAQIHLNGNPHYDKSAKEIAELLEELDQLIGLLELIESSHNNLSSTTKDHNASYDSIPKDVITKIIKSLKEMYPELEIALENTKLQDLQTFIIGRINEVQNQLPSQNFTEISQFKDLDNYNYDVVQNTIVKAQNEPVYVKEKSYNTSFLDDIKPSYIDESKSLSNIIKECLESIGTLIDLKETKDDQKKDKEALYLSDSICDFHPILKDKLDDILTRLTALSLPSAMLIKIVDAMPILSSNPDLLDLGSVEKIKEIASWLGILKMELEQN